MQNQAEGRQHCFCGFSKAFDSVSRSAIPKILAFYGVPEILIATVMELYEHTTASVQTSHGPSEQFRTSSGVLQGDTLAPLLFIIVLDFVLRHALRDEDSYILEPRTCSRRPCVRLPALAYADDIALLCTDPDAAQRTLTRLHNEGLKVGLKINAKKTEVMHIGTATAPSLRLPTGEEVKTCDDFRYLGAQVMSPDCLFADRRTQAWKAAIALKPIFHSSAADATKVRLFRAAVESVLVYGLEAVPIPPSRAGIIDASYRRLLRYALGIHYPDTVSNQQLKSLSGVPDLSETLRKRRLSLLGHVLRDDCRRLADGGPRTPLSLVLRSSTPIEPFRRGMGNFFTLAKTYADDLTYIGLSVDSAAKLNKDDYKRRVLSM